MNLMEKCSQQSTNNNNGVKQTWVCVVDLMSLVYDNELWNSKGTFMRRCINILENHSFISLIIIKITIMAKLYLLRICTQI